MRLRLASVLSCQAKLLEAILLQFGKLSICFRHSAVLFSGLVEQIVEPRADVFIVDEDVRVFHMDSCGLRASEVV
jgi:hypothetical protein